MFRRAAERRAKKPPFGQAWLRGDLAQLAASFQLSDDRRHFVSSRWLENVLWMESAAQRTRRRYYALRLATVIGAVILTALASSTLGGANDVVKWMTFVVSLVVALSAAVDGFFRFGDRWRHYRSLVEELKSEGWSFYELSEDPYAAPGATHETAFPTFAKRVNALLARETQTFISAIAAEVPQQQQQTGGSVNGSDASSDATDASSDGSEGSSDATEAPADGSEGSSDESDVSSDATDASADKTEP